MSSSFQSGDGVGGDEEAFFERRRCCCFWIPTSWQQIRGPFDGQPPAAEQSLWQRTVGAVMKLREWSELVAGPRWKTFIRRFNRNARLGGGGDGGFGSSRFQYDPLSYALNFDDGQAASPEMEIAGNYRSFSTRYATSPHSLAKVAADPAVPPSGRGRGGRKVSFVDGIGSMET